MGDSGYMDPGDFTEAKMKRTNSMSREYYKGLDKSTFIFYSTHTADSR